MWFFDCGLVWFFSSHYIFLYGKFCAYKMKYSIRWLGLLGLDRQREKKCRPYIKKYISKIRKFFFWQKYLKKLNKKIKLQ